MPGRHCYQLCRRHKCRFQMQMTVYKSRTDIPAAQICFFFTLVVSDSNDHSILNRNITFQDLSGKNIHNTGIFQYKFCFSQSTGYF